MLNKRSSPSSLALATGLVMIALAGCDRQEETADGGNTETGAFTSPGVGTGPHSGGDPHAMLSAESMAKVALQHLDEGRPALAMETLDSAIQRHGDDSELRAIRGSLLLQRGELGAALADVDKAVTLEPGNPLHLTNRAQIYRAFKRDEEALADLNNAVELSPDLFSARYNRGSLAYMRGELEMAMQDFEHCIALDPHSAPPYFNRAAVYDALGERELAIADIERFIQIAPSEEWKTVAEELLAEWRGQVDEPEAGAS